MPTLSTLTALKEYADVASSDTSHATLIASTIFEDALVVDLDQCANGSPIPVPTCDWQNGNLNGGNSTYAEGESVPYRYEVKGLPASSGSHTFRIKYDFSKAGIKAFDFLTKYNVTQTSADPCSGSSGVPLLCPGLPTEPPQCFPFPSDPFAAPLLRRRIAALGAEVADALAAAADPGMRRDHEQPAIVADRLPLLEPGFEHDHRAHRRSARACGGSHHRADPAHDVGGGAHGAGVARHPVRDRDRRPGLR